MKRWKIAPLSQAHAMEIAKAWHYPEPYDFYDLENDPEDYEESFFRQRVVTAIIR